MSDEIAAGDVVTLACDDEVEMTVEAVGAAGVCICVWMVDYRLQRETLQKAALVKVE